MDQAIQESAGGQHHRSGKYLFSARQPDAGHAPVFQDQIFGRRFADFQARDRAQLPLHRRAIKRAIRLGAGPAHSGAFAAVEHAELDAGRVRRPAHQTVQGIDFAHQMALADPTDGGIAGHFPQRVAAMGEKQGAGAGTRRRRRSFRPGMAAADHDDIKTRHAGSSSSEAVGHQKKGPYAHHRARAIALRLRSGVRRSKWPSHDAAANDGHFVRCADRVSLTVLGSNVPSLAF